MTPLFTERLQIGDDIGAVLWIGNSRKGHLAPRDDGLRVLKISIEVLFRPAEPALAQLADVVRVVVSFGSTGTSANYFVEYRPHRMLRPVANEVTCSALLEDIGTVLDAGRLRGGRAKCSEIE